MATVAVAPKEAATIARRHARSDLERQAWALRRPL